MAAKSKSATPFLQPRSHWFYNLAILFTGILIFVFIPLFILTPEQTKQYINNGRELQVARDVIILICLFTLCIALYYWVFTLIRLKNVAATHVMFIFSWVALTGFLFPLTNADGMFLLIHAKTNVFNVVIVSIISFIFAVLFVSKHAKTALVFMSIFLAFAILPSLPRAFSQFEKQKTNANAISLSPDKNLILVGLDGVPGHILIDVLNSNPSYQKTFKDFTLYSNVTSSSPATKGSLRGIVHGNHDFTRFENPSWGNAEALYFNQQEQVNFISGSEYNFYNKTGKKLAPGQYGEAEQRNELLSLYRNVVVRITTNNGVKIVDAFDAFFFKDREGKFYSTVEGYDKTVNALSVESDKPAIFYSHFTFTHSPLTTDESCNDRKTDYDWFKKHQNVKGLTGVTLCGLRKYSELINKLKQLGIYDQSMIVLLSDHGQFPHFYETSPHDIKINNGRHMGFDRYQPFLMIKPINQQSDAMETSDRNIVLDDLAQTNCNIFQTAEYCETQPGVNILDETDVPPENFFIHVVRDEYSSWSVKDHDAVSLPRNIPLIDALNSNEKISVTRGE